MKLADLFGKRVPGKHKMCAIHPATSESTAQLKSKTLHDVYYAFIA
jgi:hypothetical protein